MDVIQEVIDDAQILYTKKDVIELLEKQQEQMNENARNAFCRYCQFDCEGHPHDDCTLLQEYIQTIKGER